MGIWCSLNQFLLRHYPIFRLLDRLFLFSNHLFLLMERRCDTLLSCSLFLHVSHLYQFPQGIVCSAFGFLTVQLSHVHVLPILFLYSSIPFLVQFSLASLWLKQRLNLSLKSLLKRHHHLHLVGHLFYCYFPWLSGFLKNRTRSILLGIIRVVG